MTAVTSTTSYGPPTSGQWSLNDTFTDANGTVYTCVQAGFAAPYAGLAGAYAQFADSSPSTLNATGVGTLAVATGLSVSEQGNALFHQTVITLAALSTTIVDANQAGSKLLYTFPEGRILVLGVTANGLTPTTTTAIASTLNSGVTASLALGTVAAAADGTLTSTEADLLPSTSWASSTTINVAAAAVSAALAASAQFDGTSAAKTVNFNLAVPTATDIDADATVTWTGVIKITWVFLGDY